MRPECGLCCSCDDARPWTRLQSQTLDIMRRMGQPLTIGKVAALAEVTPDTIRYYERLSLLPKVPRTAAGYRLYPENVVHRLSVIRHAQKFGFSLTEIAAF